MGISKQNSEHTKQQLMIKYGYDSYDQYEREMPEKELYLKRVRLLTEKQQIDTLENYDLRGRAGTVGAYHLDHIISIHYGFMNGIDPIEIADINNLRFIPWEENLKKGAKYDS
jgi:hypothetical protein